jgi:hypothetical protein
MWSILQAVAALSDRSTSTQTDDLVKFFTMTQWLLPCKYCKESYGPMLRDCVRATGKSFGDIILSRQLSLLVFCVHNKVNEKLASQRWDDVKGVLKSRLGPGSHAALDCEETAAQVLSVLDKRPTILSVYKRDIVFQNEPINLHATHLLCIILSQRADADPAQGPAFRHFINILCIWFGHVPNASIQTWCQVLVQALRSGQDLTPQLRKIYFNFYPGSVQSLDENIKLFISSGCGAGTCK